MKKDLETKILIVYHSGSGSTKTIAEMVGENLKSDYSIDIIQVSAEFNYDRLNSYDLIIFGFPTYNYEPSSSMVRFVEGIPDKTSSTKAVVFTTCGMYSGNTSRIMIKKLKEKKFDTYYCMQVKGPDSYLGLLNTPKKPAYEEKLLKKIDAFSKTMKKIIRGETGKIKVPFYKWYSPFNYPLKVYTTRMTNKDVNGLHQIKERCNKCKKCVSDCVNYCWKELDEELIFNSEKCEFCLRCVHNCKQKAIVFSDKMKDSQRFDNKFYKKLIKSTEH